MKVQILAKDYGVGSGLQSVTSFTEFAPDGQDRERWKMLHPLELRAFRISLR
ncbi:hypothetical protein ACNKHS_00805 [Shigella flexneri]